MCVDGVLFDLLSGLLDSWSLWDDVAGGPAGRRWRGRYLRLTCATGAYRPYPVLVAEAARAEGLPEHLAGRLLERWDELQPWPEADAALQRLSGVVGLGVVTNCSSTTASNPCQTTCWRAGSGTTGDGGYAGEDRPDRAPPRPETIGQWRTR